MIMLLSCCSRVFDLLPKGGNLSPSRRNRAPVSEHAAEQSEQASR
jgi:hypothetical protein